MTQFAQWRDRQAGTSTFISLPLSARHVSPPRHLSRYPAAPSLHSLPLLHTLHPRLRHFLRFFHFVVFLSFFLFFLSLCLHADNLNHAHSPRQAAVADGGSHCGVALDAEGVSDLLRQRAGLGSCRLG